MRGSVCVPGEEELRGDEGAAEGLMESGDGDRGGAMELRWWRGQRKWSTEREVSSAMASGEAPAAEMVDLGQLSQGARGGWWR